MHTGIPVVVVEGALGRDSLPVCRDAIEAAVRTRPTRVVIDLWHVTEADENVPMLLDAMRRAAHWHGVAFSLAAVSTRVMRRLEAADAVRLFDIQPTSDAAVSAALTIPRARRTQRPTDRLGP